MPIRSTYTYSLLDVSPSTYNEIARLLRAAGYDHAFIDGNINMHGIGLATRQRRSITMHVGDAWRHTYHGCSGNRVQALTAIARHVMDDRETEDERRAWVELSEWEKRYFMTAADDYSRVIMRARRPLIFASWRLWLRSLLPW